MLYTGREYDSETGLYHYRNRYYSTELGRFVSRDPILYRGRQWNLFQYADGRPILFTDPTGTRTWWGWFRGLWKWGGVAGKACNVKTLYDCDSMRKLQEKYRAECEKEEDGMDLLDFIDKYDDSPPCPPRLGIYSPQHVQYASLCCEHLAAKGELSEEEFEQYRNQITDCVRTTVSIVYPVPGVK